jgi:hypothetical protein
VNLAVLTAFGEAYGLRLGPPFPLLAQHAAAIAQADGKHVPSRHSMALV